jgi:FtsZ-interacting cell division protein YlmF
MSLSASLRRAVAYFEATEFGDETVALPADYFVGQDEMTSPHRLQAEASDYEEIYAERRTPSHLALVPAQRVTFCLLVPQEFNDAQRIADRFREGATVLCDLQGCGAALARRVTDFCSGLVYALEGSVTRLDGGVLLLAAHDVELAGEAAAGLQASAFFNQVQRDEGEDG